MYTTKEAAQRLGISMRRVNALVASGDLEAQRFGRSWMLDERSVHERAERGRTAGRPNERKNERNLAPFTLMNRNHPVLDFVYNRRTRETADIVPREGIAWKPLGIGLRERTPNRYDLAAWIASRSIPDMRRTSPRVARAGARHGIDLMFDSWGLNLSDQYWFKPVDIDVDWHGVNYFENGYEEALGETLLGGSAPAGTSTARITHSPDTATPGMLSKTWIHRDGTNLLVKSGTGNENREPYNELLATKLLARLLDDEDFVAYSLTERHGRAYSTCPTFITSETELIPAADVLTASGVTEGRDLYRGYLEAGQALGVSNLGRREQDDRCRPSYGELRRHTQFRFDARGGNPRSVSGGTLFDNGCGFTAARPRTSWSMGATCGRPIRFAPILLSSWRSWRTCRGTIRPHSTGSSMT
ncbi:MAG: helix-turn-helix domain-containing protein [Eggerthellaceae bacterium]